MGHVVHLPPIPQHPRTPGHKAFRSQLTANELGGIRFAGLSGPPYNPDQPEPTPSDNQGLWGSGVDIFPRRSHTYRGRRMPMGVTSNWCHPQGHHARRPPATVPIRFRRGCRFYFIFFLWNGYFQYDAPLTISYIFVILWSSLTKCVFWMVFWLAKYDIPWYFIFLKWPLILSVY